MSPLRQGPDGRFLGYQSAIPAWFPVLLDSGFSDRRTIEIALTAIAKWCQHKAARCLELAAQDLDINGTDTVAARYIEIHNKWLWRRDVLRECAAKLAAGPGGKA